MTRQNHRVRMLARMTAILLIVSLLAGLQVSAAGQVDFSDVKESQSYYADICWAAERGIVTGSNGKFRPEARVSVQQFFTMLSRSIPVSEEEKAAADTSQDSMLYHLRRAARNGWTDGFGYVPELYKDANVAAGLAWYAALRANGTQIYSGTLYGEQSNRRTDGMNAAKKLGLAAADADAAKAITRAEAVQIIRAATENKKTLPTPEIVTEMQDTVIGLDQSDVNLVYTNLMLVPAPIRTAFREDGWKICFDSTKIAAYSEQSRIWGIHGMTVYR